MAKAVIADNNDVDVAKVEAADILKQCEDAL